MCNCSKTHKGCHNGCNKPEPLPSTYRCGSDFVKEDLDCFNPCDEELYDSKSVRYKTKKDEKSELINLGIQKGENLEYILELYGQMFYNVRYIESPNVPGFPLLNTFEKLIVHLFGKIDELQNTITAQTALIDSQNTKIGELGEKINNLKYPTVSDTTNIGFVTGDTLNDILQTIINNQ